MEGAQILLGAQQYSIVIAIRDMEASNHTVTFEILRNPSSEFHDDPSNIRGNSMHRVSLLSESSDPSESQLLLPPPFRESAQISVLIKSTFPPESTKAYVTETLGQLKCLVHQLDNSPRLLMRQYDGAYPSGKNFNKLHGETSEFSGEAAYWERPPQVKGPCECGGTWVHISSREPGWSFSKINEKCLTTSVYEFECGACGHSIHLMEVEG